MDDRAMGEALLALLTPVHVDGVTDELTGQVIGQIDASFRAALSMIRDPRQGLCLMVGVLSITASMVGGSASAMLDLPASDDGLREGKVAALDCVRAMATRERVRH